MAMGNQELQYDQKNTTSVKNEETNWNRKRKNEKHPGSQGGGGGKDRKQKTEIARVETTNVIKTKYIE